MGLLLLEPFLVTVVMVWFSLLRVRIGEEWFLFWAGLPSLVVGALLVEVAGRVDLLRIGYSNIRHWCCQLTEAVVVRCSLLVVVDEDQLDIQPICRVVVGGCACWKLTDYHWGVHLPLRDYGSVGSAASSNGNG